VAAFGPHYTVSSTCYAQGGTTASGAQAYVGEVANNFLPLGTRILLDTPAFGRREYRVEDHIGSGSELDIFDPSEAACNAYGRQERGFRVITQP
jgi:3D (Asp-Asp-Asp) domain-containing protein